MAQLSKKVEKESVLVIILDQIVNPERESG